MDGGAQLNPRSVSDAALKAMAVARGRRLEPIEYRMSVPTWDVLAFTMREAPRTPVHVELHGLPIRLDESVPDGCVDVRARPSR